MHELLDVYDLKNQPIGAQERNAFYRDIENEWKEKGVISKKVKQIRLLLMNSNGRIYLQKRSKTKEQNPNLYDKTVGGHVQKGQTATVTLVRECAEELGFPAVELSDNEFAAAIHHTDLSIIGLCRNIDHLDDFHSIRITNKGNFTMHSLATFYIGYYDGAIRFVDGESSGIEVYSLEDLKDGMKKSPEKFTDDLRFIVKNYEKHLVPVSDLPKES